MDQNGTDQNVADQGSKDQASDHLTNQQVAAAELTDWRKLGQALHTAYAIPDFPAGARFVTAVAEAAEAANHHPDLTLRYGVVDITLGTHEQGLWVTGKDIDLARAISGLAADHGLTPDPGSVVQVEWGLDTADNARVRPFWAALLLGSADAEGAFENDIVDLTGRVDNVWFQRTEPHDVPLQRFHADVWVAPESARARIDAAVAAGGTVVDDSEAPSFVVLADPDGNKACVCTSLERA